MKISKLEILTILLFSAIITFGFFSGGHLFLNKTEDLMTDTLVKEKNPFDGIELVATSAYVYEVNSGRVLYEKNSKQKHPLASVAKIMVAAAANEILNSDDRIEISRESISSEGDSGLYVGELWNLGDLIDLTLLSSSNDGAVALASAAGKKLLGSNIQSVSPRDSFIIYMNEKSDELDLEQTFFLNETGLDRNAFISGSYGTAEDIARLFSYIIKTDSTIIEGTRYASITLDSLSNRNHQFKNTNEIIEDIPGLIGSKTGYTDIAGGNVVVAFDPAFGSPVVISILGSGQEERFSDVKKLVKAVNEYSGSY